MKEDPDRFLTGAAASRYLSVHPHTLRRWTIEGRIRYYRFGTRGDRRYRKADLLAFLTEGKAEAWKCLT